MKVSCRFICIDGPGERAIEKPVDKSGYLVLWSEFNQKPMQFLQEWCHMIVFGLSKYVFAVCFLDLCLQWVFFDYL